MSEIFKSRKVKTVLSAAMSLFLILSSMLISVSAADDAVMEFTEDIKTERSGESKDDKNPDEKMKEALTAVKTYFDIDEKIFTVFNYNYNPENSYSKAAWYFSWSSSDGGMNINVTVMGDDQIIQYSKYNYKENYGERIIKFAEISKSKAKSNADAFLKKIFGDDFGRYKLSYQYLGYPSERYSIAYVLTQNGYGYPEYQINVEVDKITGEVMNFYRYNYNAYDMSESNFNFENASEVITQKEALKSYLDKAGVELVYTSQYDWEKKELTVKPIYRLKNTYNEYISAVSGELITINNESGDGVYPAAKNSGSVAAAEESAYGVSYDKGGVSFSEAETAGMENLKNYITADKAIEIMIEAFGLELGDLSEYQKNTNLSSNYINKDQYFWSIYLNKQSDTKYENYSASIDARNGNIISYSSYAFTPYYDYDGSGIIKGVSQSAEYLYTYDEAKEIVLEQIKKLCPYDMETEFELSETAQPYQEKQSADKYASYTFSLLRKANGVKFESNGIYVNFDNITGKITSYSLSWYENIEFPKLDNVVSPENALDIIADYSGYNIYYVSNGKSEDGKINAVLVYRFDNSVWVDPFTGKCIGWNFEEVTKSNPEPNYRDLSGHWSEEIVQTLTNNGIYVWSGDTFAPDKGITRGELFDYLKFYTGNYYYFTESVSGVFVGTYSYMREIDVMSGGDSDEVLTKQEAAKIICEIIGYGEIGKYSEIFNYPFSDDQCDEQYRGYIAILKALKLISGDGNGNFNAKEDLTRAGAASIIYNIIMTVNS